MTNLVKPNREPDFVWHSMTHVSCFYFHEMIRTKIALGHRDHEFYDNISPLKESYDKELMVFNEGAWVFLREEICDAYNDFLVEQILLG